jgi:hypothetical protein
MGCFEGPRQDGSRHKEERMSGLPANDRDRIHGMVTAGNYGWAILALLDLIDVQPIKTLDAVEGSLKSGRLRHEIQAIMKEAAHEQALK